MAILPCFTCEIKLFPLLWFVWFCVVGRYTPIHIRWTALEHELELLSAFLAMLNLTQLPWPRHLLLVQEGWCRFELEEALLSAMISLALWRLFLNLWWYDDNLVLVFIRRVNHTLPSLFLYEFKCYRLSSCYVSFHMASDCRTMLRLLPRHLDIIEWIVWDIVIWVSSAAAVRQIPLRWPRAIHLRLFLNLCLNRL